jgi:hypothetical protein
LAATPGSHYFLAVRMSYSARLVRTPKLHNSKLSETIGKSGNFERATVSKKAPATMSRISGKLDQTARLPPRAPLPEEVRAPSAGWPFGQSARRLDRNAPRGHTEPPWKRTTAPQGVWGVSAVRRPIITAGRRV